MNLKTKVKHGEISPKIAWNQMMNNAVHKEQAACSRTAHWFKSNNANQRYIKALKANKD